MQPHTGRFFWKILLFLLHDFTPVFRHDSTSFLLHHVITVEEQRQRKRTMSFDAHTPLIVMAKDVSHLPPILTWTRAFPSGLPFQKTSNKKFCTSDRNMGCPFSGLRCKTCSKINACPMYRVMPIECPCHVPCCAHKAELSAYAQTMWHLMGMKCAMPFPFYKP